MAPMKQRAMTRAGAIARQAAAVRPGCCAAVAGAGFKQGPKLPADADLGKMAEERGIEAFLVSFVDIQGALRSKMVPAAAIRQIQKAGAGFAPFAAWLDYGPDAADLIVIPDSSTLLQVPFQPELGFVIGDCYIGGERVMDSPRWVLKEQIEKAAKLGYTLKTGVEPEFFLLSPAGEGAAPLSISDAKDTQEKPCYDTQALMRRFAVLQEIVTNLNACGFGVYQTDHEDGNGQFEINWKFGDCLQTADQHVFFKWLTKTCAERHGFRATFMDRPFKELTGSGCHVHASLWAGERNVFEGGAAAAGPKGTVEGLGLSDVGLRFMQGVLQKCRSFCAITNPTVNSFKRLNGIETNSGATWSPNMVSFSGNNRTHLVRVPEGDRFELRVAGGAVNPYLLQASLLASGLWGLEQSNLDLKASFIDPKVNMYTLPADAPCLQKIGRLPENLLDALRLLEKDRGFTDALGCRFVEAFLKLKKAEWDDFTRHLSSWELEKSLDC